MEIKIARTIATACFIAGIIISVTTLYLLATYPVEDSKQKTPELIFNNNFSQIIGKIPFNESAEHMITIFDENGTKIFEGDLRNETLLNTTLTLNMTLDDFLKLISRYQTFENYPRHVYYQIADQLNEANK